MERVAGTFQDRLVAELRLAGANAIEDAGAVLEDFIVRFNQRFAVSPRDMEVAYRPVGEEMCLDRVLCFKHSRKVARDNTVRYRVNTLQLLLSRDRPTYAGLKVDVLEGLDGQLVIEHEGRVIPSQQAPSRPDTLRGVNGHSSVTLPDRNGLSSHWATVVASLDRERAEEADRETVHRVRKKATPPPRQPTPKQVARWEAVHTANRKGLSIRGITRETGIHRITVKKYLKAESPPMAPLRKESSTRSLIPLQTNH